MEPLRRASSRVQRDGVLIALETILHMMILGVVTELIWRTWDWQLVTEIILAIEAPTSLASA